MPICRRILHCRVALLAVAVVVIGAALFFGHVARHGPDPQETIVLGQSRLFADSTAAFRILVRDHARLRPIAGAQVRVALESAARRDPSRAGVQEPDVRVELGRFVTGAEGSLSEAVRIPAVAAGRYDLVVESSSQVGRDRIVRPVEIKQGCRMYVATDKPVYQPGQTIHMRVLALDEVSLKPAGGLPVLFEVMDAQANKVFKTDLTTSPYGLASCDFVLADEVNLGDYRIRATAGAVQAERVVQVQRYVLPKFKLALTTDKPFYLPSETLRGDVHAGYFFGKPVAGAEVTVRARTLGGRPAEIFQVAGTTDPNGTMRFQAGFGTRFVEDPPDEPQERRHRPSNIPFEIEVVAKDSAGHEETAVERCTLAREAINIHVFPEGGDFLEGVDNVVYILTAYPTGQPAVCDLEVNGAWLQSDLLGVTVFKTKLDTTPLVLRIQARDASGRTGQWIDEIRIGYGGNDLLLRTDRAVYRPGEQLGVTILSSRRSGPFFLDVLRQGQTVMTRTVTADHAGQAQLAIDLPADLSGTLVLKAYVVGPRDSIDMVTRLVHVRQAEELQIGASLDKDLYRPGETVQARFQVSDGRGTPVPAALSLTAVDEAVFYVCENQPGILEQFFLTDGRLPLTGYQMAFAVSPAQLLSGQDQYQNLARALFSWGGQAVGRTREYENRPDEDARFEFLYAHTSRQDYTLRAESYPGKLAQADAFHQRYLRFPLAALAIAAILLIPLGVLSVFAHSLFRLFRDGATGVEGRTTLSRGAIRRIYLFTLVTLLPIATYLTTLTISDSSISIYSYGPRGIGARAWPMLVVILPLLAGVVFPGACCSGSTDSKSRKKIAIKSVVLSVLCLGIAVAIQYVGARAITNLRSVGTGLALLLVGIPAFVSLLLCYVADRTSRRPPGRFYAELGRSGRIVLVGLIAQILVLPAWLLLPPMPAAAWEMAKRPVRVPIYTRLVSSEAGLRRAYYGGMAGVAYYADPEEMMGGMGGYGRGQAVSLMPEPARVRRFFPETLFWQPQVIADEAGEARVEIPLADSITAWKMNVDAVSMGGQLGNATVDIRVFQDFFVDPDLPVALTRGDEIAVPIQCYNYLSQPQVIQLSLEPASWYEIQGPAAQAVELAPNEVRAVAFRVRAQEVGTHELAVLARGTSLSDAVRRRIEVRPDGAEVEDLQGGLLAHAAEHTVHIPPEAVPNSQRLLLKVYPSMFSEVIEGLESVLRMPHGCFEQTSSVTYPNVMALLYLKHTNQLAPEVQAKARACIAAGYQKLLTFVVKDGGFDWFGHPPAAEKLTAYGIMQSTDLARVHDIDRGVIDRASRWLQSRQNRDGSWEAAERRDEQVRDTAYIAWALLEAGGQDWGLHRALAFLRENTRTTDSSYTLALAANVLLADDPNDVLGRKLLTDLQSRFRGDGRSGCVISAGAGALYSQGSCLDVETTALFALALMRVNAFAETVPRALTWLCEQKDRYGTWRSTQATVLAMKALIAGTHAAPKSDAALRVRVTVNGRNAGFLEVTGRTCDLLHTLDLTGCLQPGANVVRLAREGEMGLPYRLVGTYWALPAAPTAVPGEWEIDVRYDRDRLRVGDPLWCNVQVLHRGAAPANMIVVELGLPPGFAVDPSAFARLVDSGLLARYELTSDRAVLYVRSVAPRRRIAFRYGLRALRPLRVQVPPARVYEYYYPENRAETLPCEIVVE